MPRLALAGSYFYCIGVDCLQLFQLPRVPGLTFCQKAKIRVYSKLGGLNFSWSRHWQKVSLNGRENLNSFKKIALIEKSWSCLNATFRSQKYRSRSRFTKSLHFFLKWEKVNFSFFLYRDFLICQDFWAWSPSKSLKKCWDILINLKKFWQILKILTQQNLNQKVSSLKSLLQCDQHNLDNY